MIRDRQHAPDHLDLEVRFRSTDGRDRATASPRMRSPVPLELPFLSGRASGTRATGPAKRETREPCYPGEKFAAGE